MDDTSCIYVFAVYYSLRALAGQVPAPSCWWLHSVSNGDLRVRGEMNWEKVQTCRGVEEVSGKGRKGAAAWAEVGRLSRWAGRRCTTQVWKRLTFHEDCKEMVWSLLLLVTTLTFTKLPSLFAFLFPVCVSSGYFYLQHCRVVPCCVESLSPPHTVLLVLPRWVVWRLPALQNMILLQEFRCNAS